MLQLFLLFEPLRPFVVVVEDFGELAPAAEPRQRFLFFSGCGAPFGLNCAEGLKRLNVLCELGLLAACG